jgi:hypothetical protein
MWIFEQVFGRIKSKIRRCTLRTSRIFGKEDGKKPPKRRLQALV